LSHQIGYYYYYYYIIIITTTTTICSAALRGPWSLQANVASDPSISTTQFPSSTPSIHLGFGRPRSR
jgi:hypothetical protein